jgi:hypothetical protein
LSVIHFKPQIEEQHVTLLTDHKPLSAAFKKTSIHKSDCQQCHLSMVTKYVADIVYIRGTQNVVADCLSWPTNALGCDLFDLPALAMQQETNQEIKLYIDRLKPLN